MAVRLDTEWDTSSNREAQGEFVRRSVDISSAFNTPEIDTDDIDESMAAPQADAAEDDEFPFTESQVMSLVKSAYSQGSSYQQQILQPRWLSAYNAFNNKHSSDSKYSSARFRGRSRLYRPKTRATARKKQAEAAAALFSTSDALLVRAADETDPMQKAGAELINELIRFRTDRGNELAAVPWFMISMGAHLTAQMTGICVSKQYWEYRRELVGYEEKPILQPLPPQVAMVVGKPAIVTGMERVPKYRVIRDRPRIELMPPEDVIRDPAAAWEDQAQDSSYLILRFPMSVEAARTFLDSANDKSAVQFYDVPDETLAAKAGGATDPANSATVRRAREQSGNDRLSDHAVDNAYKQVWLHENFFRIQGKDYCFWTLGTDMLISDIILTQDAYPEQGGARPVVIGNGAMEPFKIDPMAPVEAWQDLQREINDIVNLRLDTLKQTIAPLAKVRRGRSVDVRAIQNRSPDSIVYLQDLSDLEFDRPGDVSATAYAEVEKLNADFDDQAGNFSTGSVQTNRQLGETVGGMRMMMSSANALGEFDLRVWVETWVEPVLRQLVKLEQYYESDENVIAVSAKRAKLMPRFGMSAIVDGLLNSQVAISVDVGTGSSDPIMAQQKFAQAMQVAIGTLGQSAQARIKQDAVIDEIFGKAGYKDASERFFNPASEEDPRLAQAEQVIQQLQQALMEAEQQLKDRSGDQKVKMDTAKLNAVSKLAVEELRQQNAKEQQFQSAIIDQVGGAQQHARQIMLNQMKQPSI